MNNVINYCLPDDVSVEDFLQNYWQKKPLLIKNGLPNLKNLFNPNDVLALALEEEVTARLIKQTNNTPSWQVKSSPLSQQDFDKLPPYWTVLIQNLEAWSDDLGRLWQAFDFIPKWQQDDIMVSYAPDGGSVGAHFDHYDVFLAQGYGKRRWQLGKMCDETTTFIKNEPICLLDDLGQIIFDEVLEAGDVLYVPPWLAHFGAAIGDCLTFSFGFRRPNMVQILDKITDVATNQPKLLTPLHLPQQRQDNPNRLHAESLQAIKTQVLAMLDNEAVFNQALLELLSSRSYEPLSFYDEITGEDLTDILEQGATLSLNHASRFIYQGDFCYINGEQVNLDNTAVALLDFFIAGGQLDLQTLNVQFGTIDLAVLAEWVNYNWLIIADMNE